MKQQLHSLATTILLFIALLCASCDPPPLEVDPDVIQEKVYNPTVNKKDTLNAGVTLFIDYSTCVKDAVANSVFFAAIRPRITGLKPTMYAIKGESIEYYSSNMDSINLELNHIQEISYANINGAVEQICNANQQAILITDCEYWTKPQGERTDLPYLKEPFIQWLNKGYSIYIIKESYLETYHGSSYPKIRFYFFFTDDKLSNNVYEEVSKSTGFKSANVTFFKSTNSDIIIHRNTETVDNNLVFRMDTTRLFDYIEIDDSWKDIQQYIMEATDDDGNLISGGNPLIKGVKFSNFNNYTIEDIEVHASNITAQYMAIEDSTLSPDVINITDGFVLDTVSLKNNELNVKINGKIFAFLNNEFGGNLLRLDFVIKSAKNKPVNAVFSWDSMSKPNTKNISVQESIKQAIDNPDTNPAKQNNGIIHTLFIKTESYK
jgi:hypothetical protein